MSLGGMFRPGMRGYLVPLAAGVAERQRVSALVPSASIAARRA
jgi:hypothetical protein